jgi:CheY-like chemotaxis protein
MTEVCLIEDNPGDAVLVRQVLRDYPQPINVRVVPDGEQAVRLLADEHYQPDLIVLDLNIPKIPGLAVLALEPARKAPVIIFSSAMDPAEIACALQLGAKEFVRKPIDLESFADAVRGMIGRWTQRAEACGTV